MDDGILDSDSLETGIKPKSSNSSTLPEDFMDRITEIFMFQLEKKYSGKWFWRFTKKFLKSSVWKNICINGNKNYLWYTIYNLYVRFYYRESENIMLALSDAQRKANDKYIQNNYKQVKLSMPNAEALEQYCKTKELTKAGFIRQAIKEKMEREP